MMAIQEQDKIVRSGEEIGHKITQIMTYIRQKSCDTTVIAVGLLPIGDVHDKDGTKAFNWPSRYARSCCIRECHVHRAFSLGGS